MGRKPPVGQEAYIGGNKLERKPPMDQNTYKGGYNREEEPPRRNKSVKGGEIFEGKSSQNIKNRERRRNLRDDHLPGVKKGKKEDKSRIKLNPIKWTQQKLVLDAF